MLRRRFLQGTLLGSAVLGLSPAYALTFEEYKQQQAAQFNDYQARFKAAQQAFANELKRHWRKAELTTDKQFVQYSRDLKARSVVDFDAGTLVIEAQADSPAAAAAKIKQSLAELLAMDTQQAYEKDPVLQLTDKEQLKENAARQSKDPVVGDLFQGQDVDAIIAPAEKSIVQDKQPVARVVIQLPAGSTAKKAALYQPLAEKYAAEQKVPAPLVMAIMHSESAFNPMARSHIPAFGLMQIVPQSAGRDTTEYLTGRSRVMTASELYQPEANIRSGAAYLHILNYRYLKAIKDPVSRQYCVIAAYNTGAGNVARAFTGSTQVSRAADKINRMSPDQVYAHLIRYLPYQETRDYLKKVSGRVALYSA